MFDALKQHEGVTIVKSKKWTLDLALELVRASQPFIQPTGYHAMIMGDVLNKGESQRDLELVFMPIRAGAQYSKPIDLLTWLGETFGKGTTIRNAATADTYKFYMQFKFDGLLINTYIG